MADRLTIEKRSWNMSQIHSKNTKPELKVRSVLHRLGYRFRIHKRDLPGKPDIVLSKYKKVVFVHGCFWHRHDNCVNASRPKTNSEYWEKKIETNIKRDKEHEEELINSGWEVIIIWECEIEDSCENISSFLKSRIFHL